MEIRPAKKEDVPQIAEMGLKLMAHHKKLDSYFITAKDAKESYLKFFGRCTRSKRFHLIVAVEKGNIIGYCLGNIKRLPPVFKRKEVGYITDAFVLKQHRRKGVIRALVNEMFAWFRKNRLTHAELHVAVKNPEGMKTWEKLGFRDVMKQRTRKL